VGEANVFFGHHCPKCGTTVGVAASIGSQTCPGCGGPMQATPGGPPTRAIANVVCKKCGTQVGMMVSVGGEPRCPSCHELL